MRRSAPAITTTRSIWRFFLGPACKIFINVRAGEKLPPREKQSSRPPIRWAPRVPYHSNQGEGRCRITGRGTHRHNWLWQEVDAQRLNPVCASFITDVGQ